MGNIENSHQSLRLLIVEDEVMVAWEIAQTARELGHEISQMVGTEEAAIEAVLLLDPDIILMDLRLADGDGLDAARKIRQIKDTSIIFCTAYVGDLLSKIGEISRTQLIAKPVRKNALRNALISATRDTGSLLAAR